MINNLELTVEVVDIEPEAVYKGMVYDQTVVVRLQDGTEIKLFDGAMLIVKDENIGDVVDISVSLLTNDIQVVTDMKIGISLPTEPSSKWSYDFVGEISTLNQNDGTLVLDIDIGTMAIELHGDDTDQLIQNAAPGDRLYLPASRADLVEIQ